MELTKGSRCVRTDGRNWRCGRKASAGDTMCEIHRQMTLRNNRCHRKRQKQNANTPSYAGDTIKKSSRISTKRIEMIARERKPENSCPNNSDKVFDEVRVIDNALTTEKPVEDGEKKEANRTSKAEEDSLCLRSDVRSRRRQVALAENNWWGDHLRWNNIRRPRRKRVKIVNASPCNEDKGAKDPLVVMKRKAMDVEEEKPKSSETKYDQEGSKNRKIKGVVKHVNDSACGDHFVDGRQTSDHERAIDIHHETDVVKSTGAVLITNDSQCTHTDGNRWRCKRQAIVGFKYCEHHSVERRTSWHKNIGASSDSEDENKNDQMVIVMRQGIEIAYVTEDSRCSCTDGRGWRCSQPARAGYTSCEHHFGTRRLC